MGLQISCSALIGVHEMHFVSPGVSPSVSSGVSPCVSSGVYKINANYYLAIRI
jgi:hypothetical protein